VDEALIGRRVAVSAPVACGKCDACLQRQPWECTARVTLGIQRPGSNAEYTVVPAVNVQELPAGLPFETAAAFAASGPLAWAELDAGHLRAGECLFVPGASGSVGMLLISLAHRRGAHVIAATRGRRAAEHLRHLGADAVVDSSDPDLAATLRQASPHGGVDVVVDNVANVEMWGRYWPAVARRGRIVLAGQAGNAGQPLPIDVVDFYNRQATVSGLTIGDPRPVAAFWAELRVQPLVIPDDLVEAFPLARAADAHRRIEAGHKIGHVVLSLS
jgi:NADPH2:quinone reductase